MTFINYRLNPRCSAGFQGGPEFSTREIELKSGISDFIARWSMPRFKFVADYLELVNAGTGGDIYNAFMAAGGRDASFRMKDWNDFQVEGQSLGTGDGTSTPIQLIKVYPFGPTSRTRHIKLPLNVVVTENGTPKTVTVDPLTGIVTPSGTWTNGAALAWTGQFDVRVRFGQDYYPFTRVAMKISQCTVDLVEDKRP